VYAHSEEEHHQRLQCLCRICGQKARRCRDDRAPQLCRDYAVELAIHHRIYIESDCPNKHPAHMCRKCYMRLMQLRKSKESSERTVQTAREAIEKADALWREYHSHKSLSECPACSHYQVQRNGGRPLKPARGVKKK